MAVVALILPVSTVANGIHTSRSWIVAEHGKSVPKTDLLRDFIVTVNPK